MVRLNKCSNLVECVNFSDLKLLWAVFKFLRINNIDLKCSFVRCRKYHKSWWNGAAKLHISVDLLCGTTAAEIFERWTFWKIQPTQIDSRPSANSWNMYALRRQNKRPQQTLEWWTQRTQESPSEYSSTSRKAPGYRLSPDHFQTVKQMLAPDWAQKMLCIIVPNRRTASPDFFSCVRTRRLLSRRTIYTTATAPKTSLF